MSVPVPDWVFFEADKDSESLIHAERSVSSRLWTFPSRVHKLADLKKKTFDHALLLYTQPLLVFNLE